MKKFITVILTLIIVLVSALPVYGIADPDSFYIHSVYAYQNILNSGDMGFLIDYSLNYAVVPTETAGEAFIYSFIDTDGVTILNSVAPYVFQNSGYDRGAVWIYFTPAQVTALSIMWAGALYTVRVDGNPALTWAGDPPSKSATIDSWVSSSPSYWLAQRVLYLGDIYELLWTLDIVTETTAGTRLATLGEAYFTNVIPNLRLMAPDAFSVADITPEVEKISYGVEGSTDLKSNPVGTPLDMPELANALGMSYSTGTVTVTNASGTVTGAGTSWNKGMIGRRFRSTDGNWYFVTAVASATSLTISPVYVGGTLAGQTYVLADSIMLSSIFWMIGTFALVVLVIRYGKSAKIAVPLIIPCVVGGAALGALAPELAWGFGVSSAILSLYVIFFKPSSA